MGYAFQLRAILPLLLGLTVGCAHFHGSQRAAPTTQLPNPLLVPIMDTEYLWQQAVDTLDDYFKIAREERMRTDGGVVTDGRIYTHPETAASYLEPWRRDSTPGFERLQSTLQSMRRYATLRISPDDNGYAIELAVYKELEDVAQPENSRIGAATLRYDDSLIRNEVAQASQPLTLGWIALGRDIALEQRMLAQLQGRLVESAPRRIGPD